MAIKLQESSRRLQVVQQAMSQPDQDPDRMSALRQMQRSLKAEVALRQKALQHEQSLSLSSPLEETPNSLPESPV